ncbi:MAG TPA: hypothetical protein VF774_12530, partial [Pseudoduganella sp.]
MSAFTRGSARGSAQGSAQGGARDDTAERGDEVFARFDRSVAARLWQFMRGYRAPLAAVLLLVLLYTLVQVLIPVAVRHA